MDSAYQAIPKSNVATPILKLKTRAFSKPNDLSAFAKFNEIWKYKKIYHSGHPP